MRQAGSGAGRGRDGPTNERDGARKEGDGRADAHGGGEAAPLGESRPRPDLWRGLAALVEPPSPERAGVAEALGLGPLPEPAEHTDLFLLQLHPYASVYVGPEGMLGGEARDRVTGFWRAVGRRPPDEPDHLAVLLALHASLAEEEAEAADPSRRRLARHARTSLFREHLACWLPPYLLKLGEVAGPFYRAWASILREALAAEAEALGPPEALPVHLQRAPALDAAPPEGGEGSGEDLPARLLAPARSGLVLTRSDLLVAARSRGLPLRIGERRYALRGMLSADPEATVAWLAEEAEGWVERHGRWTGVGGPAARFWRDRAEATGALLRRGA